jgi:hypothetical protein
VVFFSSYNQTSGSRFKLVSDILHSGQPITDIQLLDATKLKLLRASLNKHQTKRGTCSVNGCRCILMVVTVYWFFHVQKRKIATVLFCN